MNYTLTMQKTDKKLTLTYT